jgi:pimeloyl-ACP methyl ester carboxylesterase
MTTFSAVSIPVAGGSLSIHRRQGSAPTLVFLHYWGGSARTWNLVIGNLGGQDAIAYDQRGWGAAASVSAPYSLQQMAADVDAIVASEQLEQVVLVGHSMGGKVAQVVVGRRPTYLSGLVLVAPAPPKPPARVTREYQQQLAHAYDDAESAAASLDNVLSHKRLSDDLRQQVIHDSLDSALAARTVWPLQEITADISESVRGIEVSALVLLGQYDPVEPPVVQEELMLTALGQPRMITLPNAGHLLPLEAPVDVAAEIRRFLDVTVQGTNRG